LVLFTMITRRSSSNRVQKTQTCGRPEAVNRNRLKKQYKKGNISLCQE
jgi:hypothetical protein